MEKLKAEILGFYNGTVDGRFAERMIKYYQQKKERFRWLFGDKDRLELEISEQEAINHFFNNNYLFSSLYWRVDAFFRQADETISDLDLKRAIYQNRITYQKNVFKFSKFFRRYVEKEDEENKVDFQDFYDTLKTAKCIISIHPVDFLSASENCSYSSCFSITSCHHTGCSAYMRDDHTIVAYTTMGGRRKLGRQWIYFDGYYIIMGKIYGSLSQPVELSLRTMLEERYAQHLNLDNSWIYSTGKDVDSECVSNAGHEKNCHSSYAVYFDLEAAAMIRHKQRTSSFGNIDLVFEDGLDKWGDDTAEGHMLFDYCYHCDSAVTNGGTYVNDDLVCDYCLSQYYQWCEECEEYHHVDELSYYIEDLQYSICDECFESGNYAECQMTGTYWSIDELVTVILDDGREILVSSDYAEKHYQQCDECGCYHEKLIILEDKIYCSDCYEEKSQLHLELDAA